MYLNHHKKSSNFVEEHAKISKILTKGKKDKK